MGHSGDDAVHKIPHKMKTQGQNQLKFSVLVWFTILYRTRYKKTDVRLVQCPFKATKMTLSQLLMITSLQQRGQHHPVKLYDPMLTHSNQMVNMAQNTGLMATRMTLSQPLMFTLYYGTTNLQQTGQHHPAKLYDPMSTHSNQMVNMAQNTGLKSTKMTLSQPLMFTMIVQTFSTEVNIIL